MMIFRSPLTIQAWRTTPSIVVVVARGILARVRLTHPDVRVSVASCPRRGADRLAVIEHIATPSYSFQTPNRCDMTDALTDSLGSALSIAALTSKVRTNFEQSAPVPGVLARRPQMLLGPRGA